MSVENLKSTNITNLDAVPVAANTSGEGAPAYAWTVNDYVTISANASLTSTYRVLRVPAQAKLKSLVLESEAMAAGKVNISAYYSDSTTDGTQPTNQALIIPSTGDQFFASDVDLAAAVTPTSVLNESGNFPISKRNQPLWQALGLSSDPGGWIDIVLVVHTTAITTGAANCMLRCEFVW